MHRKKRVLVRLSDCFIDPGSAQRTKVDQTFVKYLMEHWNPDHFGTITVAARPGGRWHLADGAHRWTAAMRLGLGDEMVEADLVDGGIPAEADRFVNLNNRRNIKFPDKFRARVLASEPLALMVRDVIEDAGYKTDGQAGPGHLAALQSCERVMLGTLRGKPRMPTPERLRWVLDVVTAAWGHTPEAVNGDLIQGLGKVRERDGEAIDTRGLIGKLASVEGGASGLLARARAIRTARRGNMPDSMAEVIVDLYNTRRTTHRLPPWRA